VYVFFGGKGGVGKTTCATAAAIRAVEDGRRVLIVSTDPAHSLGDALALRLSSRPTRVRTKNGSFHAVELDADQALNRWMKKRKKSLQAIAEQGTYLDSEDIEQLLQLSMPGVDELVGLIELRRLARSGKYDEVIVDTAPTGHTLRLLAMPETLLRIASVFDGMLAKHRFLSESLGGVYRPNAGDELVEEIDRDGRELTEMLQNPKESRFCWVLLPEMVALEETKDGVAALAADGIAVSEIIVNRVKPPSRIPCPVCGPRVRAETAAIQAIRDSFPQLKILFVPQVEPEPRGIAEFRHTRRSLEPAPVWVSPPKTSVARKPQSKGATDWADLLTPPGCRLVMFGGKGGVGKTTCSATLALTLAKQSPHRKILLLSTDPAHSLGDVLQMPLDATERELPGFPSLRSKEMDAHGLFETKREQYKLSIDELFDSLQGGSRFDVAYDRSSARDLIDLSPPGIDEIFGILSVSDALLPRDGFAPYDLVVLDTAPTGHALRLLEMPATALEWVRTLLSILLKYRKVTGLGNLATDLLEIARQMRELLKLLHDPRQTRMVVVTRAAQLPLLETGRLLRKVKQLKIAVSAVVVNAATVAGCAQCRKAAAVEQKAIKALATKCPKILAPAIAPPPRGLKELGLWAQSWEYVKA
jgi:arsenite-transporting ATPase